MSVSDASAVQVRRVVRTTSIVSAALGVVLSPIPFADELLLIPIYGVMSARIGKARGLGLGKVPWRSIASATMTGLVARAAFNVSFAFIPGVAAVSNAITAAALTGVLGRYADLACAAPESAQAPSLKDLADALGASLKRAPAATPG